MSPSKWQPKSSNQQEPSFFFPTFKCQRIKGPKKKLPNPSRKTNEWKVGTYQYNILSLWGKGSGSGVAKWGGKVPI